MNRKWPSEHTLYFTVPYTVECGILHFNCTNNITDYIGVLQVVLKIEDMQFKR